LQEIHGTSSVARMVGCKSQNLIRNYGGLLPAPDCHERGAMKWYASTMIKFCASHDGWTYDGREL